MQHGEAFRKAREEWEAGGPEIPDSLHPPEIMEGLDLWYGLFWRLSTERQIGMCEGPIPASAIDRVTMGWHYEDADTFEFCMNEMDRVYRQWDGKPAVDDNTTARDAFKDVTASRRKVKR